MNSCAFFERQLWRNDKCKHCFKTEAEHSLVRTSSSQDVFKQQQQPQQLQQQNQATQTVSLKSTLTYHHKGKPVAPITPSVDKAPLSIRRTLTPAAIETFSKRISQSPPTSPNNNPRLNKHIRSPDYSTQSSNTTTASRPIPTPNKSTDSLQYRQQATQSSPYKPPTPTLSSANSTPSGTPTNISPKLEPTPTTSSKPPMSNSASTSPNLNTSSNSLRKTVLSRGDSANGTSISSSDDSLDLSSSSSATTPKMVTSPSRQSRSQSADNSTVVNSNPSDGTPITPKPKSGSFFLPSSTSSPSIPVYQQKHVRDQNGIYGSSPNFSSANSSASSSGNNSVNNSTSSLSALLSPTSKSNGSSNSNNSNGSSSSSSFLLSGNSSANLGSNSPMASPRAHPIGKGIIKLRKNSELKKSNSTLKRKNLANLAEQNNEKLKIFGSIQSILLALPGISSNVVLSIMDILYNQDLNIDYNTLVSNHNFSQMAPAIANLNAWVEAQEYVRDVITVQSCVRRFLAKRRTEWLSQVYTGSVLRERNIAFRHLVQEERRYNSNLEIILQYYYRPLKSAGSSLVSDEDFRSIFSSVEEIYSVHQRVLLQFELLNERWPCVEGLGDIFLRIAPDLKVYGNYVKNFKNAIDTLERCRNDNPKFANFISECCENTPGRVYDLMALIATPLNHLSVYQRQLFTIASHTPNNWPDYVNINNSVTMMKEIEQLVQDNLAQAQNAATLINIYRKINNKKALDPFVIPGRIFLHEGKLTKFEGKKQDQLYYYYLCNDIIIFGKKYQKDLLKYKNLFNLSDVVVSDHPDTGNHKNIISISKKGGDSYSFQVDDAEEKKELLKLFGELCTTNVNKKLFGTSITELVQREGPNVLVPSFILKSCNAVFNHLHTEGIFRVSPNQLEVDQFKESLNKCTINNLDSLIAKLGAHHLAAIIKTFFRDLIPPLLTHELFDKIVELGDRDCDIREKITSIRSMLNSIPACNQATLQTLVLMLRMVGQNSERNKMNHSNLAIVFGPNLVKPAQQTIETSLKIPLINNVITLILDNYQQVYQDRLNVIKMVDNKIIYAH